MFRTSWTARCVAAAARVSETAASSSPTATNARNTASDASGDLASSGTPVAEKYQRVSLHFNKVNNFVFFLLILLPFAIFPTFFTEKVRPLLGQFKDPYALPQGFDPNTATPEEVARRIQQQEAASSTAMKRPLLTSSERQAAEAEVIHLAQQLRRSEEQLQNTEHRSVTLTQHLNALTEELRFSSDALQKAHGALQQESHQHTTLKEEYSTVLRELHAWKAKCEDMKNEHSTTLAERDAMRGELEGLRGDVEGWQRRHAASEELWKAQTNSTAADLQRQVDELTSQLHEERSRSERLTTTLQNAQAEHARRCEAHRLEVDATRTELVTTVSRLEQQRSAGSAQLDEASREVAAAEQRCNSLLSRTETAERISDELRRERDQLFSELAQARDVNQLLAVRLKAATIDKEAHEMEVEARRLLTKQNEDMEKQLTELRRTIRSMMGQQQQLNSFVHSPSSSSLGPALRGGATPGANNAATTTVTGYASSSESRLSYGSSMISPDRTIQPR